MRKYPIHRYRVRVSLSGIGHMWVWCHARSKERAWRRVRQHVYRAPEKYGVSGWGVWMGYTWRALGSVQRLKEIER